MTDHTNDYLYTDNLIDNVRFVQTGTGTERLVDKVFRCNLTTREAARSNGVYTTRDVRYRVSSQQLDIKPKPRDSFIDDEDTLTILDVQHNRMLAVYKCTCRNFVIEENLKDTINIEEADQSDINADGTANEVWYVLYSDVVCRFSPADAMEVVENDGRQITKQYEVFLLNDLDLSTKHRIVFNGKLYSIVKVKNREDLYSLMSVIVQESSV